MNAPSKRSQAGRQVREVVIVLLGLVALFVLPLFVIPLVEFTVYAFFLTWMAAGLVFLAGYFLWRFIRWNWN